MMKFSQKSPSSNFNLKTSKKRDNSIDEFDVFGKDLKLLLELSHNKEIPDLIFIFGYFIKNYGLLVQGIFRVSGNKTRMDEIKLSYLQKKLVEVSFEDIHNITGLYKLFLREIPGGLIPYSQAIDLIKATKSHKKSENLDLLTTELFKLPVPHYNLLKFTCSLLSNVCKCCGSNLMNSENLGTVFGPTFFSSIEDMSLLSIANSAVSVLIQNYNELFKVSAPVHTNLNQSNDCNIKNGSNLSTIPLNNNISKCSNDQNITIQFGESYLTINMSNINENSFHEEESIPFTERQDSSLLTNSFISNTPQFSNSLALAFTMCVNNHLFDNFNDNQYLNSESFPSPQLISNMMLNGNYYTPPSFIDHANTSLYINANNRNVVPFERKRLFDEGSKYSLPRNLNQSNNSQFYLNNFDNGPKGQDSINKSDTFSMLIRTPTHTDIIHERHLSQVPQLDLSSLTEQQEPENNKSQLKTHDSNKPIINNRQTKSNSVYQTIHENQIFQPESQINELHKKILTLKNQLRQFEDTYFVNNGVKPDKTVKLSNEWYQKTLKDLKYLKQDKEQFLNSLERTKEFEADSAMNIKKKLITGSGDNLDQKYYNSITPLDSRLSNSRPVSVLSETTVKAGVANESARSNTLNSTTVNNSTVEDLTPRECENLRRTLDQISNHLKEERIRDNRPEDLDSMTYEQIECEKVTMQKALLNFECKYGRRKNPNAIQLMRPLYDRYRQVKKRLSLNNERKFDNPLKSNLHQSAWTTDKPLSFGYQSNISYNNPQTNNLSVMMPSNIQFDNSDFGEDSVSYGQNKHDTNSRSTNQQKLSQSNKKNANTFQYRKKVSGNDVNNNSSLLKSSVITNDDLKFEYQKLLKDKKDLQRILKDFENNFERETKKKVEKSDRLPMEREYACYKIIKNRIKELEDLIENSLS